MVGNGFHRFQLEVKIINTQISTLYIFNMEMKMENVPVEPSDFIIDEFLGNEAFFFNVRAHFQHLIVFSLKHSDSIATAVLVGNFVD